LVTISIFSPLTKVERAGSGAGKLLASTLWTVACCSQRLKKVSLIPNAQNTLLQSNLINSPPVNGMIKAEFDEDCDELDPEVCDPEPDTIGVLVGTLVGAPIGVLVGVVPGTFVGVDVGVLVGVFVGPLVGVLVGVLVGRLVGVLVGVFVGEVTVTPPDSVNGALAPVAPQALS
jgi:hypothetical protein